MGRSQIASKPTQLRSLSMKKSERLLQLLVLLRGKRRASTAKQLAEAMNVSERTIYRDIQSLILSGLDISGEAGVGYLLHPGSEIPPLMFTQKELEALVLGIRLLKAWGDDELVDAANKAQAKIKAVVPDRVAFELDRKSTKFLVPNYKREAHIQFSQLLRDAIDKCVLVKLHYKSEDGSKTSRTVRPLGLMFWGQAWTLVAWCEMRSAYRLFRLDRIQTAKVMAKTFTLSASCNFSHYVSQFEADVTTSFWDE